MTLKHEVLKYYQVCSNDDPGLTLTYFKARSNLVHYAFVCENQKLCQCNFIFASQFSRLIMIWRILWLIIIRSMSIFLHYQIWFSCVHAQVLTFEYKTAFSVLHAYMLIFLKNLYTVELIEDWPVSVSKVKCLNLQRNARNLNLLSVPVHRMFLRDRHRCTEWLSPFQLSPICFTWQKQDGQIAENV